MRLQNKVAIVTGGAQGIGKEIALALAREGASVVLNDVNKGLGQRVVGQIKRHGRKALFIMADVSAQDQVGRLAEETLGSYGRIDILVNNAGVMQPASVEKTTAEKWDTTMAINLKGTFLACKAVMGAMKQRKCGKIINISSLAGKSGGIMVGADYAASKAGVIALTKVLARELAPYGINVNAVAPGAIQTQMISNFPQRKKKSLLSKIPLGRFGTVEDISSAVVFLASEESSYITGATLDVNGGLLMD